MSHAYEVLASELGCSIEALRGEGVQVVARPPAGSSPALGRRYPPKVVDFAQITLGVGCVVSASPEILDSVREVFAGTDRDEACSVDRIARVSALLEPHGLRAHGPHPRFLCDEKSWLDVPLPAGIKLELVRDPTPERAAALVQARWPHTQLGRSPDRPATALAIAKRGHDVLGVCTASTDSARLRQIGIDIDPAARGRGLGPALTSRVTRAILDDGHVPYYGADASNLPSQRTAIASGYRLAWSEVFTYAR